MIAVRKKPDTQSMIPLSKKAKEKVRQFLKTHSGIYSHIFSVYRWIQSVLFGIRMAAASIDKKFFLPFRTGKQRRKARQAYLSGRIAEEPDSFVLYRILGNDLPPRHQPGQTLNNLKFILKHEPEFENCRKRWILNRIIDPLVLESLESLLQQHNQEYLVVPFDKNAYSGWEFQFDGILNPAVLYNEPTDLLSKVRKLSVEAYVMSHKNRYVMNSNASRNLAIEDGRKYGKWIFPWDGNCFLTRDAWKEIQAAIIKSPWLKYFIVPMARITNNGMLLQEGFSPEANEEPQIIFRKDAGELFNEQFPYGKFPKVELLKKLGVPGVWDKWVLRLHPWDKKRSTFSADRYMYNTCGWVARLNSGNKKAESSLLERRVDRDKGIVECLKAVDISLLRERFRPEKLAFYEEYHLKAIRQAFANGEKEYHDMINELSARADSFLSNGPYSVVNKTSIPPSGDLHDYLHPAPYSWPNPNNPDGLPYIFKDGERAPGTRLYEKESEKYDRTSLQRMFDETTILSLAYFFTGQLQYAEKAVSFIRTWFVDENTRMNPHLKYAQIQPGVNNDKGSCLGLIETKDFYFFLDAVRMVSKSGFWTEADENAMKAWCREFLYWLINSEQGKRERQVQNNHGLCYDLQVASLAAYLNDLSVLYDISITASARLMEHIDIKGRQPRELKRKVAFHYCAFNLQSWLNIAFLLENTIGYDLWHFSPGGRGSIEKALHWLLPYYKEEWPYKQIEKFDRERLIPLFLIGQTRYPTIKERFIGVFPENPEKSPCYFPHDGIPVYWILNTYSDHIIR